MSNSLGFYRNNKAWIIPIGVGVVMFAAGFSSGRFALPAKVVVTEKIKEVIKEVVVEKIKTEVKIVKVYVENKAERIHRVVTEEKRPDGTEIKTTNEDINTDTVVHENTNTTEIKYVDRVVEKLVEKMVEKEKLVLNQPNWHVGAGVGVAIPYYLGQGSPGVPGLEGVVISAQVERKIIGPFFLGLQGNTQGVVGLSLSGAF